MSDLIQLLAVSSLHESPFNPRRTWRRLRGLDPMTCSAIEVVPNGAAR